jgi:hypothetical protein
MFDNTTFEIISYRHHVMSNLLRFEHLFVRNYDFRTYIGRTLVIRKSVILKFNVVPFDAYAVSHGIVVNSLVISYILVCKLYQEKSGNSAWHAAL